MGSGILTINPALLGGKLLGSIACTPATAKAGDSVWVEVRRPDGTAYNNEETVPISLNGVLGSAQYLTWDFGGAHTITAIAHRRGAMEKLNTTIQIAPRPAGERPPSLEARWQADEPTVAQFVISRPPPMQRAVTPARLSADRTSPLVTLRAAPPLRRRAALTVPRTPRTRPPGVGGLSGSGTETTTYEWDFGDGVRLGTVLPSFAHDYGPRLDGRRLYQTFQVSVTIRAPRGRPVALHRTITVHNPYVLMKRRGILQPPIADADLSARFSPQQFLSPAGYRARFAVRNPEPVDVQLTRRRIERVYGDDVRFAEMLAEEDVAVVLKAGDTTVINVFVAKQLLPPNVIGFAAHYTGHGPNRTPVRVTAHFDLPQHLPPPFRVIPELQHLLEGLASRGALSNPRMVPRKELEDLEWRGLIEPGLLARLTGGPTMTPLSHTEPPDAVEGKECDPWNLPDVVPDGLFCMPTQETEQRMMPPRFMNAKRGDIILSPGDGGLVAAVLKAVTPAQPYSHSGIMTRNRDEITHSTASEKRLMYEEFVDGDGIRPDVLKYLWPGVITQTVDQSVHGQPMVDPETGKTYPLSGFASELGQVGSPEVRVPMVVKPDPLIETTAIRSQLHGIADWAVDHAGKGHYRFYCFTNPTIGLSEGAPAEAKWGAGTFPSVCSSLIWMAIKQSGAQMEGALEPADMDGGAQIALGTPDGLYLYDAEERLAAGQVLFNRLHNLVMQQAGSWGDALTDAADNISNQILNSFASDWSDLEAADSEKWRDASDANAVSPQNLMFYDTPLYGYAEPLIFRDWRVEDVVVHKWKKVEQTGTMDVVRFKGQPVQGANVQLSVSQFTASQADGTFVIPDAPAGPVLIDAQKVQDDMLLSAQVKADVAADKVTDVIIDLQAPSHLFRRIRIEGWMDTIDYEFAAAAYPHCMGVGMEGIIDLDPGTATHGVKTFDNACDDAVGRLYVSCDLQSDDSVRVSVKLRCYNTDDPSDDPDDYSQAKIDPFVVGPDKQWSGWIYTDDDNYAEAHFTVTNRTNQS